MDVEDEIEKETDHDENSIVGKEGRPAHLLPVSRRHPLVLPPRHRRVIVFSALRVPQWPAAARPGDTYDRPEVPVECKLLYSTRANFGQWFVK